MSEAITLAEALERLDGLLPDLAPPVWDDLRPPISASGLDALRSVMAPYALSDDVIELLSWHDGQEGMVWWPMMSCGPLLSSRAAIYVYELAVKGAPDSWRVSWLPVAQQDWFHAGIELANQCRGLIIDASLPDPPQPIAPFARRNDACDLRGA